MGKKNLQAIFKEISSENKKQTNHDITCKVYERSDIFEPNKDYIGLIIYAVDSDLSWKYPHTDIKGRSFSLIVQERKVVGSNKKKDHSNLLRRTLNINDEKVLCGGFWFKNRKLNFEKSMINKVDQKGLDGNFKVTDGNWELSLDEQKLVTYCWEKYTDKGPGYNFPISERLYKEDILNQAMEINQTDTVSDRETKLHEKQKQAYVSINSKYPADLTEKITRKDNKSNLNHPAKTSEYDYGISGAPNSQNRFFKFKFTKDRKPFTFRDFINLYTFGRDPEAFTQVLISALKRANEELEAYLWECPPIDNENWDKQQFEFVVTQSLRLDSAPQDLSSFREHFKRNKGKMVCDFTNLGGDAILVVPLPRKNKYGFVNYKNLSRFTDNASFEEQHSLWQRVAVILHDCIDSEPKWLSTNGLAVPYLHIRIDDRPKYYSYEQYKKLISYPQEQHSKSCCIIL